MEEPALEDALEVQAGPGAFEGLGLECARGLAEPRTAVSLGEWRALEHRLPTKQTCDAVSLTACSSESWLGSYIAATAPSLSIKRCANPASKWALFIKHSLTNTLDSGGRAVLSDEARWWPAAALLLSLRSMCARESSTLVYVMKKPLQNLYEPGSTIFGTEILGYTSKLFIHHLYIIFYSILKCTTSGE